MSNPEQGDDRQVLDVDCFFKKNVDILSPHPLAIIMFFTVR